MAGVEGTAWTPRLGEHLEATRRRALMSRRELARRMDVTEESIRRWEHGATQPSPACLARLIAVLALDTTVFSDEPAGGAELPALARRFREERLERGITQLQAAEAIGVAQATYAGWELGRALPGHDMHASVAGFLGIELSRVTELAAAPFVVDSADWPPLGKLMGSRRQALRMTREALAATIGVSPSTVAAWELGYRTPRVRQLPILAEALTIDIAQLVAVIGHEELAPSPLGVIIQARERRLGLNRSDVAHRAGLDESTLSRWMAGRHVPRPSSLGRLAAALDVPASLLLQAAGLPPLSEAIGVTA